MNNIEKQLHTITETHMTAEEKSALRGRVFSYVHNHPAMISSPYVKQSTSMWLMKVASFSLVCILAVGGGVSFASERALPGDTLYPVKQYKEKVAVALAKTPGEKLLLQTTQLSTRVEELNTLKKQGADEEKIKIAETEVRNQAEVFSNSVDSSFTDHKEALTSLPEDILKKVENDTGKEDAVTTLRVMSAEKETPEVHAKVREAIRHARRAKAAALSGESIDSVDIPSEDGETIKIKTPEEDTIFPLDSERIKSENFVPSNKNILDKTPDSFKIMKESDDTTKETSPLKNDSSIF